ncbi:unnamed protein product, partial [Symbiodinium microadriaticum]
AGEILDPAEFADGDASLEEVFSAAFGKLGVQKKNEVKAYPVPKDAAAAPRPKPAPTPAPKPTAEPAKPVAAVPPSPEREDTSRAGEAESILAKLKAQKEQASPEQLEAVIGELGGEVSTPEKAKTAGQASMEKQPGDGQEAPAAGAGRVQMSPQTSPGLPHVSPPLKRTRLGAVDDAEAKEVVRQQPAATPQQSVEPGKQPAEMSPAEAPGQQQRRWRRWLEHLHRRPYQSRAAKFG